MCLLLKQNIFNIDENRAPIKTKLNKTVLAFQDGS